MTLTRLFHFHRLFDHIAFPFHAGAESPVELLDHPCFSILCLLCLRLSILPCLTTAGHCTGHSTYTGPCTGISGNGTNRRSANCAPGRPLVESPTAPPDFRTVMLWREGATAWQPPTDNARSVVHRPRCNPIPRHGLLPWVIVLLQTGHPAGLLAKRGLGSDCRRWQGKVVEPNHADTDSATGFAGNT